MQIEEHIGNYSYQRCFEVEGPSSSSARGEEDSKGFVGERKSLIESGFEESCGHLFSNNGTSRLY